MGHALGRHLAKAQQRPRGAAAASQGGVKLRRATVVNWDATNGYIILLDGANITNPPVLAAAGAIPALAGGDTVSVLRQGANVLILGKILIP
jgi:hypothetical protein